MPVANALIGLGTNLGEREATLEAALELLRNSAAIELHRQSPWIETEPAGGPPDQPPFLNGAAWLKTELAPQELLSQLQAIESTLGRVRKETWGPRTLDLDLLLYDDLVLNQPELQIPHRWLPFRQFVLDPAVLIAPDWVHPSLQKSIYDLRQRLRAIPYWFVIGGSDPQTRQALAEALAKRCEGYSIAPLRGDDILAGELPLRELPPREVFISSVDWTMRDTEGYFGLKLCLPGSDASTTSSWRLDAGTSAWPLPKARIQLCANQKEFLTTDFCASLAPIYRSLAPVPTLNLLEGKFELLRDQAFTMIAALTPG